MRQTFLLFTLLLLTATLFAQEQIGKDSLFQIWNQSDANPDTRMKALKDFIDYSLPKKAPDSIGYYGQLLLEFATENKARQYQGDAHYLMGRNALNRDNDELALKSLTEALSIYESIEFLKGKAATHNLLGVVYQGQGEPDKSIEQLTIAIDLKYELGDSVSAIYPILNTASAYEAKGDIQSSLDYNLKGLGMALKYEQKRPQGIAHNNLGNNYKFFGDIPNASDHYLKSLTLDKETGNTMGVISSLSNLGLLYSGNSDFPSAYEYLNQALELARENNLMHGEAMSLSNIGATYAMQKEYPKALEYFQQALEIVEANKINFIIPYHLLEIGYMHLNMGQMKAAEKNIEEGTKMARKIGRGEDVMNGYLYSSELHEKQGNYSQALTDALDGMKVAEQSGVASMKANFADQLVGLYKHFGRDSEALAMYELQVQLQDSIYNEENTRALIRQEIQYKFKQEALQDSLINANLLAAQKSEIRQRNLISYFLLGILLITLISGGFIYSRYRLIQQQKQIIQEEKNKSEAANAKLREIDESKSRFFTNISHEFRTPLTVISGMSEQMQGNDKAKKLIRRNTNHLLELINQILDLRKLESGHLKTHYIQADVSKYLRYILESFQTLATDKDITLEYHTEVAPLELDFDPEKILRIVSNLLSNALKFTPQNGKVILQLIASENNYQFSVEDTGAGIPESKLPYLFDQFYQVDDSSTRSGEGTGIGLTLVKELIELMSGKISVKSESGKGSSFTVSLPRSNDAPFELDISNDILNESRSQLLTPINAASNYLAAEEELPSLLMVEDNPDVMEYLITCLQGEYQLLFASDGQEGIDKALEAVPDIIISDVMMPKKDGFDLCNTLKMDERTSHIPIVLLTAKADVESRIAGLERGADAYLAKPFNPKELEVQLKNLLAIRLRLQSRYASMEVLAPTEDEQFKQEDAFVLKLKQIVLDHLDEEGFGVQELCKEAAMSRSQVHNKIKSLTNLSTSHFIRLIRVKKAIELLSNPDLNIGEVAMEVGINNLSYFSRIFSEETGLSPNKYREKLFSEQEG